MYKTKRFGTALASRYVDFLLRYRLPILVVMFVLTIFSILSMKNLVMDNSNEAFFRQGDPAIHALEKFRRNFGNEDTVAIAIKTDNAFTSEILSTLEALVKELQDKVPYVDRVTWMGNVEYLSGAGNEIVSGDLLYDRDGKKKDLKTFKHDVMTEEDYLNSVISRDGKTALVFLEFLPYPTEVKDPRKKIAPVVQKILSEEPFDHLDTAVVGAPIEDSEYDRISAWESIKLALLCLLVQCLILFGVGKTLKSVLIPIGVTFLSLVLTIGIISVAGWPLSMMVIMLPAMLFCVCIGDTIHIISVYQLYRGEGLQSREALIRALSEVAVPCFLTTVTTAFGYLSFMATDITPIRLAGIFSAIGAFMALLFSLVLAPIFLVMGKEKEHHVRSGGQQHARIRKLVLWMTSFSLNHPWYILLSFSLLSVLAVLSFQRVSVETSVIKDISPHMKIRQDYDYFDEKLGGAMSLDIILDGGKENSIRQIDTLRDIEKIQNYIDSKKLTKRTFSLVNIIKRMRYVMHNNNERFRALPLTQQQYAEYLFFYETSGGRNLDKELSFLSDIARIHIQTQTVSTVAIKNFMTDIDSFIKNNCSYPFRVEYAGQMPWVSALSNYVVSGQTKSLLAAAISIIFVMALALHSWRLALLSMAANIVPVLFPLGLMGVIGVHMSISLMIFSCVIMGVAVDDTVYFFHHFKKYFTTQENYKMAVFKTVEDIGVPAVYTSISLVLGFCVFTLSAIRTSSQFGYLGAVAFCSALLADLMLSPALLVLLKPMKSPCRLQLLGQGFIAIIKRSR